MTWFHAECEDSESWSGPFDTREAAIEDGRGSWDQQATFWIDRGKHTTVEDAAKFFDQRELDYFTEQIDEYLADNDLAHEDLLVSWRDEKAAVEELQAWARKHLVIEPHWVMLGEAEEVKVTEP